MKRRERAYKEDGSRVWCECSRHGQPCLELSAGLLLNLPGTRNRTVPQKQDKGGPMLRPLHHSRSSMDSDLFAAWTRQVRHAQSSPWLLRELLTRGQELLPRFAEYYARLNALPRTTRRLLGRKLAGSLAGAAFLLSLGAGSAWADDFSASNATELVNAITSANGNGEADTITLTGDVSLTSGDNGSNGLPIISSDITIEGDGFTIERDSSATDNFRLFEVGSSGNLTLNDTTISGGLHPFGFGGGIYNTGTLTINRSTISNNTANRGGGILNTGGTATITDSTIDSNTGTSNFGGIWNYTYGSGTGSGTGTTIVTNSTVSNNSRGGLSNQAGGYSADVESIMEIHNSTISGNMGGPGVYNNSNGFSSYTVTARTTITSSTISGNSGFPAGGIANRFATTAEVILANSIVSGNTGTLADEVDNTTSATFMSNGYNLFGDDSKDNATAFNNVSLSGSDITTTSDGTMATATALILDPLDDNGGPTQTHALPSGSPAIDAITTGCPPPATDQRGITRAQGSGCDIGAFEVEVSGGGGGGGTVDPTADVDPSVTLGPGSTVGPRSRVRRNAVVGANVMIGPSVIVQPSVMIGDGSTIGEGSRVRSGATVGAGVMIGSNVRINPGASIGDNTTVGDNALIKSLAIVGANVQIGARTTIGSRATIGDGTMIGADVLIRDRAMIGMNVTIAPGVTIGRNAVIGDNQNVTTDIPNNGSQP